MKPDLEPDFGIPIEEDDDDEFSIREVEENDEACAGGDYPDGEDGE